MPKDKFSQNNLPEIELLISILNTGNLEQIKFAHTTLVEIGEQALIQVIKALSSVTNTRLNLVSVIGSFCDARDRLNLDVAILQSAVMPLLDILKTEEDGATRQNIVLTLGDIPDKRVVEPLIHHLRDKDGEVFFPAIYALGNTGDTQAVAALINLLAEEGNYVRFDVLKSLSAIEPDRLIPYSNILGL